MATFLDIGLLNALGDIFPLLLVFAIVYGILVSTKTFGNNKGLQAIIAFVIGFLTLFIPNLTKVIKIMTPWFAIFMILIIFILILLKMFGATDDIIKTAITGKNQSVLYWILIFCFVIFLGSLGSVYFNPETVPSVQNGTLVQAGDTGTTGQSAFWATLFHPKILGMLMILLIATFAAITITKETVK